MNPVEFEVQKTINSSPKDVCEKILDVETWSSFDGYGLLPGIEKAEFETRTEEVVGSRIRVTNSDGSKHIEEILEWKPNEKLVMKIHEFPMALSYMATHFIEDWGFKKKLGNDRTLITREFQLFPTSFLTRPLLNQISALMKKAIEKHLDDMAKEFERD